MGDGTDLSEIDRGLYLGDALHKKVAADSSEAGLPLFADDEYLVTLFTLYMSLF